LGGRQFIDCSRLDCEAAGDHHRGGMTISTFIALLPALLSLAASSLQQDGQEVRTVVVQGEIIMRIPVRPARPRIEWVEVDGPRCVPSKQIRGAALSGKNHVDFLLFGRKRLRAELSEDCHGLDFYSGFYLAPQDDRVCAGRDSIRSRIGDTCVIERFHRLVPRGRPVP
jgi:hypothetical protein